MNKEQLLSAAVSFYLRQFDEQIDPIDALKYYVREGQVLAKDRGTANEIFHDEGLIDGGSMKIEDREKELEKELYDLTHQVYTPSRRQIDQYVLRLQLFREKYSRFKKEKPLPIKEVRSQPKPKPQPKPKSKPKSQPKSEPKPKPKPQPKSKPFNFKPKGHVEVIKLKKIDEHESTLNELIHEANQRIVEVKKYIKTVEEYLNGNV